jgi:hypothetical protein
MVVTSYPRNKPYASTSTQVTIIGTTTKTAQIILYAQIHLHLSRMSPKAKNKAGWDPPATMAAVMPTIRQTQSTMVA